MNRILLSFLLILSLSQVAYAQIHPQVFGPEREICTDDTTNAIVPAANSSAVQSAVTNSANAGATILIPQGSYVVSDFRPRDDMTIKPLDCADVTIRTTNSGNRDISGRHGWTIAGLTFDCDDDNVRQHCFRVISSNNATFKNNRMVDVDSSIYVKGSDSFLFEGNWVTGCPDCSPSDMFAIEGSEALRGRSSLSGVTSSTNVIVRFNRFEGNPANTQAGNDVISYRDNFGEGNKIYGNLCHNLNELENCLDIKTNISTSGGNNRLVQAVEVFGNTFIGPLDGEGRDGGGPGPMVRVGDIFDDASRGVVAGVTECHLVDRCPEHWIHHNYCSRAVDTGNRRSGCWSTGHRRRTGVIFDFNVDHNSARLSHNINSGLNYRYALRNNTYFNSNLEIKGGMCTDTISGSDTNMTFTDNIFLGTEIDDACTNSSPDWTISGNLVDGITGGGFHVSGSTTASIQLFDTSFTSPNLTAVSPVSATQIGALPVPLLQSAEIVSMGSTCQIRVTMQPFTRNFHKAVSKLNLDGTVTTSTTWDHGPMSGADVNRITSVRYGGVAQAVVGAGVDMNNPNIVTIELSTCPVSGATTVDFSASNGWCADSANIGGPSTQMHGLCLGVTNQAVVNNSTPARAPLTFFVDPSCANNGDGTANSCAASNGATGAWSSINRALDSGQCTGMQAGDTLEVNGSPTNDRTCEGAGSNCDESSSNVNPHSNCSGIIIQNVAGEFAIADGTDDVSTDGWTAVGSGVFLSDNDYALSRGTLIPQGTPPFAAWYDVGSGEERLFLDQTVRTCDTSVPSGQYRWVEATGQLCVHLSNSASPATTNYFRIPRRENYVIGQVSPFATGITWRSNPGGGRFIVQRFGRNGFQTHAGDNPNWTWDNITVGWMLNRGIAIFGNGGNGPMTVINNTVHNVGEEPIRMTGSAQCTVTGNMITDVQTTDFIQQCATGSTPIGAGCIPFLADNGTAIRVNNVGGRNFEQNDPYVPACTISNNTILRVGGGRGSRARGIDVEHAGEELLVSNNYIAGISGLAIPGVGIVLSGSLSALEGLDARHSDIRVINNRIHDVDDGIARDIGGSFPSQAGSQTIFIYNNTVSNYLIAGFKAELNSSVDHDGPLRLRNNMFVSSTPTSIGVDIPATQTTGYIQMTHNGFQCDTCPSGHTYVRFRSLERLVDTSCSAGVDCIDVDSVGNSSYVNNLYGDMQLNNTGATPVLDIPGASAAVDTGVTLNILDVDHRGISRPQGPAYDVGAFERDPVAVTFTTNQTGFRLFGNGLPQGMGALSSAGNNIRLKRDAVFILRFALSADGGDAPPQEYRLASRICNPTCGTFEAVTTDCSVGGLCLVPHTLRTDGETLSSSQIPLDTRTFDPESRLVSGSTTVETMSLTGGLQRELDYSVSFSTPAAIGDQIEVRLELSTGASLDSYAQNVSLEIGRGEGSSQGSLP